MKQKVKADSSMQVREAAKMRAFAKDVQKMINKNYEELEEYFIELIDEARDIVDFAQHVEELKKERLTLFQLRDRYEERAAWYDKWAEEQEALKGNK